MSGMVRPSPRAFIVEQEQNLIPIKFLHGYENAMWIAMDYGDVIVHVFQPEIRAFYSIETLWEDAEVAEIPELS
jgi:ribosome-associated protein